MTDISTLLEKIENNTKEYEAFKAAKQAEMLEAAKSLFSSVFEEFDFIDAIVWTQYTPHFNDGEPCEFSVHDMYVMEKGYLEDEDARYDYPEDCNYTLDLSPPTYYQNLLKQGKEIGDWGHNSIKKWEEQIATYGEEALLNLDRAMKALAAIPEEIYESLGEGKVFATREGLEVEDYDHD